ncbi:hypothetical protein AB1Y20_010790 [Prymnesium parvum]|uniref:START domain-containing protein n=1 Tax=Prymnesium parvum TaxID=97485 RepID=A0AB34ISF8_PRYPA
MKTPKPSPDVLFLNAEELDIAAKLRSYQRKILSLRVANGESAATLDGLREWKARRSRASRRPRSEAEEYRIARRVQRVVQFTCAVQIAFAVLLSWLRLRALPLLALFALGSAGGLAASFACVQRRAWLCTALNCVYLLASLSFLVEAGLTIHADEASARADPWVAGCNDTTSANESASLCAHAAASQAREASWLYSAVTAVDALANMVGSALAAYALVHPLALHRYETVALDEEAADARGDGGRGMMNIGPYCDAELSDVDEPTDEMELQPIEAWVNAGEVGTPLVFMPVKQKLPLVTPPTTAGQSASATPLLLPPPSSSPPPLAASAPVPAAPSDEHREEEASVRQPASGGLVPRVEATAVDSSEDEAEHDAGAPCGEGAVSTGAGAGESIIEGPARVTQGAEAIVSADCEGAHEIRRASGVDEGYEASRGEEGGRERGGEEDKEAGEEENDEAEGEEEEEEGEEEEEEEEEEGEEGEEGEESSTLGSLRERWRIGVAGLRDFKDAAKGMGVAGLKEAAVDALKQVADGKTYTAEELIERAKALNREGKYKRACEAIEAAYALDPKVSTAISAANLRLKLGDHAKAASAYRKVLAMVGSEGGPNEREREMARTKLKDAEELLRAAAVNISFLSRKGEPRALEWFVKQLQDLNEELFSESATLYSEHGVALQDGVREIVRLVKANRLLAAGQVLRPVEKLITKACLTPRDEQERRWLTTARTVLNELRSRCGEAQVALKEFDEESSAGWRAAQESQGVRTEWRPANDGTLWVRMEGAIDGADLTHAVAVAHESELWPRWVPLCSHAEVLANLGQFEKVSWLQFDLPVMKRAAIIHWSLTDSLLERQSLLLLGASVDEAYVERPANTGSFTIADFRAIKVLLRPLTRTSARIRCVANIDLKANVPQSMMSIVTKKVAGAILSQLAREAQRVTRDSMDVGGADSNPWLRSMEEHRDFYRVIQDNFEKYFDLYGEEEA